MGGAAVGRRACMGVRVGETASITLANIRSRFPERSDWGVQMEGGEGVRLTGRQGTYLPPTYARVCADGASDHASLLSFSKRA